MTITAWGLDILGQEDGSDIGISVVHMERNKAQWLISHAALSNKIFYSIVLHVVLPSVATQGPFTGAILPKKVSKRMAEIMAKIP
jgi:hypothetical protein